MRSETQKLAAPHAYGVIRMCYPARDGFRIHHADSAQRKQFLYDPERLALRLDIFETVTAASFAAQSDGDFTLAIMVGDEMPDWALHRLMDCSDNIPQMAIYPMRENRHIRLAVRDVFADITDQTSGPILQFRQDDDDAVSRDFIRKLRQAAVQHREQLSSNPVIVLDFPDGTHGLITQAGLFAHSFKRIGLGLATGCLIAPDHNFCIYDLNHDDLIKKFPTPKLELVPAYLRLYHKTNDCFDPNSAIIQKLELLPTSKTHALCKKMGINPQALLQLGQRVDAHASARKDQKPQ